MVSKGGAGRAPGLGDSVKGDAPALSWQFVALYTVANLGAYIAFIPLLQILVPLRAAAIDPAHAALLLSRVSLCGAVAASLGNIGWGALSDRTLRRTGGRRPWLLGGLGCMVVSYALVHVSASPAALVVAVILFQLAFNAMFAPFGALLADKVPPGQRGLMSALLGLGYPLGNLVGTQVIGRAVLDQTARFLVLSLLVCGCIVPFAIRLRPGPPSPDQGREWRAGLLMNPFMHRDFSYVLASRVLIMTAFSLVQGYLLLYLQQFARSGAVPGRPEAGFASLAAVATAANVVCAVLGGVASDRIGHRRWFVFAAGAVMATGIVMLAGAQSWRELQAGSLVYGSGAGVFYAVDLALIVQVLPSLQNAGKDLGIVNLSNTLPQAIAPLIALTLLGETALSFRALFLCGAGAAALGAVCVLGVRSKKGLS